MSRTDIASPRSRWPLFALALPLAAIFAMRVWFNLAVNPMGDEAYYWLWGQHLDWSYFDHPPLQAWLLAGVAAVFGWSTISVRLLTWVTLGGTLWIFWLWSARLAPENRLRWFLATTLIYMCIPVVTIMDVILFQDHLLIFFVVASGYTFHVFAEGFENKAPRWRWLYGTAALVGFAMLTKYNGVFLAVGLGCVVLLRPGLRPLLRTWHLWLALLLAAGMQGPVLWWNLSQGLASFRFHLAERSNVHAARPSLDGPRKFLTVAALVMSPLLFIGLLRLPFMQRRMDARWRLVSTISATVFLASTLLWAALSVYITPYFYWNITAYAALAPIGWRIIGGWLGLTLHALLGIAFIVIVTVNFALLPQGLFGIRDEGAAANFDWPTVASHVSARLTEHPDAFLAATRYSYASQLGVQLRRADLMAFNPVRSQFDYWWQPEAHRGQDALILADKSFPIDYAQRFFASVEKLEDIATKTPDGRPAWTFTLYLARTYTPPGP